MSEFTIILVRPRDPNNIGAVARAMGNFGITDLRIVDPYTPNWTTAVSAVGATDILLSAKLFPNVLEAVSDCHFTLATTALRNRQLSQPVFALPEIQPELKNHAGEKIGIVFGCEKTGLSNEDIARCMAVLHIPTAARTPSINLAQAVILTCYELTRGTLAYHTPEVPCTERPTQQDREQLLHALDTLCLKNFLKNDWEETQRLEMLRTILSRQNITKQELYFFKKLIDKINAQLAG